MNLQNLVNNPVKLSAWLQQFDQVALLHTQGYQSKYSVFDWVIAVGCEQELVLNLKTQRNLLDQLQAFHDEHTDWLFGFISYDLKNDLETLESNHPDYLNFPTLHFFIPKYVIAQQANSISVLKGSSEVLKEIESFACAYINEEVFSLEVNLKPRMSKQTYIKQVSQLKQHIRRGDIYEITYCQEFYDEQAHLDPLSVYSNLLKHTHAPFTSYLKLNNNHIISASPERYLAKRSEKIISQPIKGTAKRFSDPVLDLAAKKQLTSSEKELAENVMIVDLVRNDLTKCAKPGTVKVEELNGLYSFSHVHQLISTVSCELKNSLKFSDAIRESFPMGSMTGAPKIRAMELIEKYELSRRGPFSGSIGWIDPDGDFDFNVLIRSLFYNQANHYLSLQVGGAITDLSNVEDEYKETLIKAEALFKVLSM